jgi:Zn-dependent protease with chaperone function/uncharacterized tellurite resistance protein B-like protein
VDFFGQQQQAKSRSRWLIISVILAALIVIIAVDLFVLFFITWFEVEQIGSVYNSTFTLPQVFNVDYLKAHSDSLLISSLLVGSLMGIASTSKVMSLRDGGGQVAKQMGGDLITADTKDPLRRRLYNVVEEIAIASGVPVPEVYVLEHEQGINAFAAGYSQSDAAVAVTRGALEQFNREELQGVIAHEFSHILNGDTRINIRLMGLIFGIVILSIIGRKLLTSTRRTRFRSRDNKGVGAIIFIGLGLMIIGYTGLFITRWIKAAISRQREFLADASAVQFTRNPDGISNALKKIAINYDQSYLNAESEEISHMLFGDGNRPNFFSSKLFATHPPLIDRIQRFEPRFQESDLLEFGKKLRQKAQRHEQAKKAEKEKQILKKQQKNDGFDIAKVLQDIGQPSLEQLVLAGAISAAIPDAIEHAAHSPEWAPEVMLLTVLSKDANILEKQLMIISKEMGQWTDQKIQHLLSSSESLNLEQRLPIMEMAFPIVKNRPNSELEKLLSTFKQIVIVDNEIDTFEYLLSKLIETHIIDSLRPDKVQVVGSNRIEKYRAHCVVLMSILATKTNENQSSAKKAFEQGCKRLGWDQEKIVKVDNWTRKFDIALERLNSLRGDEKRKLVIALADIIMQDKQFNISEHELLRAICASLHIPLPVLA